MSTPGPQRALAYSRISLWSYFFTGMVWCLFIVKSGDNTIGWAFLCPSEPPNGTQECSELHIPAIAEESGVSELTCPKDHPGAEYLGGGWKAQRGSPQQTFRPLSWACDLRDALQIQLSSSQAPRRAVNLYRDNLRPWPDWMAQELYIPGPLVSVAALNSSQGSAESWGWKYCLLFKCCSNSFQNRQWATLVSGKYM